MTKIIEGTRDGDLRRSSFINITYGDRELQCRAEFPFAYYPDTGPLRKADRALAGVYATAPTSAGDRM
jgi:hypothetical protein